MPPANPTSITRRNAQETRAAILVSAMNEFTRVGYAATTLEDIAERLNLTRPAVLYHFKSKELLLHAIIDPAFADVEAAVETLPVVESPTKTQQRTAVRTILDVLVRNRGAAAVATRTPSDALTCGLGERLRQVTIDMGLALVGPAFTTDPLLQVRAVACLSALGGLMAARVPVNLDDDTQKAGLTDSLVALLRT